MAVQYREIQELRSIEKKLAVADYTEDFKCPRIKHHDVDSYQSLLNMMNEM